MLLEAVHREVMCLKASAVSVNAGFPGEFICVTFKAKKMVDKRKLGNYHTIQVYFIDHIHVQLASAASAENRPLQRCIEPLSDQPEPYLWINISQREEASHEFSVEA